jgi:20S proteasome alpha/beta subunit
MTALKE